jgi:PKD repeat protein
VSSSDSSTLLERFGDPADGVFYVTAQNSGTSTTSVQITLDGAGLGLPESTPVNVTELVSSSSRSVTQNGADLTFSESLDPGETTMYIVMVGSSGHPVAKFTWAPTTPFAGQAVQFHDASTNSPTAWYWDFRDPDSGDANISTLKEPVHAFSKPGPYNIYFRSTNAFGNGYTGKTVIVWTPTPRDTPEEAGRPPSPTRTIERRAADPAP